MTSGPAPNLLPPAALPKPINPEIGKIATEPKNFGTITLAGRRHVQGWLPTAGNLCVVVSRFGYRAFFGERGGRFDHAIPEAHRDVGAF
ncbi:MULTISPECIES: hypothetical protein [Ruegeria]|uniref:hypothetical protein n=1 Tax=Ruegeria TaxID=97050 RepID=UPI00147A5ED0|nr:hypothetical protein [Ruegeria lacuscaerulensis]